MEPKFEIKQAEFRDLIQPLLDESNLFPLVDNPHKLNEKEGVLDAIEQNKLVEYLLEIGATPQRTNAAHCLVLIYEKLQEHKKTPDNANSIEGDIDLLKNYLKEKT